MKQNQVNGTCSVVIGTQSHLRDRITLDGKFRNKQRLSQDLATCDSFKHFQTWLDCGDCTSLQFCTSFGDVLRFGNFTANKDTPHHSRKKSRRSMGATSRNLPKHPWNFAFKNLALSSLPMTFLVGKNMKDGHLMKFVAMENPIQNPWHFYTDFPYLFVGR